MKPPFKIRSLVKDESSYLRKMLFLAIYVPPGEDPPNINLLDTSELARYYENWGRFGDLAMALTHSKEDLIGACWIRLHKKSNAGYGYVDDSIPEMNVAIIPKYRGLGLGTQLIGALLDSVKKEGFKKISLSVDRRNPAINLYKRLNFKEVKSGNNPTMLLYL